MAKAHETDKQRPLTDEEKARRQAAMTPSTGPYENYAARMERAAAAPGPMRVDYDRDGYPDAIVGRSQRNLPMLAGRRADPTVQMAARGQRGGGYSGVYTLGMDGYRQDQIGYRDRLRGQLAAAAMVAEAGDDPKAVAQLDARTRTMAAVPVRSHGGTGVPGGTPALRVTPVVRPGTIRSTPAGRRYTPLEQAETAPRPLKLPPPSVAPTQAGGGGLPGPHGTIRRASYGNVPIQGTLQDDGSFIVHGPGGAGELPPVEPPPEGNGGELPPNGGDGGETPPLKDHTKPADKLPADHTKPAAPPAGSHTKPGDKVTLPGKPADPHAKR